MSEVAESGGSPRRMLASLGGWTAAVSLTAAALPGAFAWLPAGATTELAVTSAAALCTALIQVALVRLAAGHALGWEGGSPNAAGLARTVVLAWFLCGMLVGPALLVAAFAVSGVVAEGGLVGCIAAWIVAQGIFALAMHRAARGLATAAGIGDDPGRVAPARAPGQYLALPLVAAALALGLGLAGGRASRLAMIEAASAGYSRVAEGVFGTPPLLEAEALRGLVDTLTPFDEAAPFALVGPFLDQMIRDPTLVFALMEANEDHQPAGAAVDPVSGRGMVWTSAGGSKAGIRLWLPADPGLPGLIASLVLAVSLLSVLAAAGLGARLRSLLAVRVAAIEALPDRRPPALPPVAIREMAALDRAIEDFGAGFEPPEPASDAQAPAGGDARERTAQVFAGMSHDLRGPLNSVVGFTDLLLKGIDGELTAAQRASVAVIAEDAERLLVRIGDILDTARLDAGRFEIERAWVPSVEILTECATGAERLVASKDVTFESRLQPGLPPVWVDKSRIVQALLSLVARALEATDHGVIVLEARRLPGMGGLRVEIGDPEMAVGAARRAVIEEAWEIAREDWGSLGRAADVSAELGPAALGLSLARRMVELHGGFVAATAGPEDRVLFALTLPLDSGEYQE